MAMIVHELGHIADLIFGSDAWKIISPDANVMGSTQAGYDNIKMVQEACFPGAPGEL